STVGAGQEISFGNVRAQHGRIAAGKLTAITFNHAAKSIYVVAKIAVGAEWEKVEQGDYTGFIMGGHQGKPGPNGGRVRCKARPREVAIVENPCMPGATFSMVKLNGTTVEKSFAPAPTGSLDELRRKVDEATKAVDGWLERRRRTSTQFVPNGIEKASD